MEESFFDNGENIEITNLNSVIRISNKQALADYSETKTKKKTSDGKTVYKKNTTTNDEKIADTCIEIFQNSNIEQKINLDNIKRDAYTYIEDLFKSKNLIESPENTKEQNALIQRKKKIGMTQYIKKGIEELVNKVYSVDYDTFIELTGIKSIKRVNIALELLDEIQNKNFFTWNEERLDENLDIVNDIVKVAVVPEVTLTLDNEIGGKVDGNGNKIFNSITDFRNADIKNKRKYIKGISFRISPSYLSNILGLERNYSEPDRKQRINFKSSYGFRLDTLLRSIERIQNHPNLAHFTFDQIQKKFGTQYDNYKNFKSRVLMPAINDINNFTNLNVELVEKRESGPKSELQYIRFIITRKNSLKSDKRYGINKLAFYIGSRMFYFSKNNIKNLLAFSKDIEKAMTNNDDILIYDSRSISDWKEESDKAYELEIELLKVIDNNKIFMDQHSLIYDDKRMCLVEKELTKIDDEEQKEVIKILKYNDKKVTNPMESLDYLNNLLRDGYSERADIFDFLEQFQIAESNLDNWIPINTMIDYAKHEKKIISLIANKTVQHFRFSNDVVCDIFLKHMFRGTFRQMDNDIKSLTHKYNS